MLRIPHFLLLDPDAKGSDGGDSSPSQAGELDNDQGAQSLDDFDKAAAKAIETVQGAAASPAVESGSAASPVDKSGQPEQPDAKDKEAFLGKEGEKPSEDKAGKKDDEKQDDKAKQPDGDTVPFHDHPRWKEVVAARDTAVQEATRLKTEYESLAPVAKRQQEIETFLTQSQVPVKDFQDSLQVLALSRTNPEKALEILVPFVDGLKALAGKGIAPDLMQEIKDGVLSEARAQEITKARAELKQREWNAQAALAQQAQTIEQQRNQAVVSWFSSKKVSDPGFDNKVDMLNGFFAIECQGLGGPPTPAQVSQLLEKAYERTNAKIISFQPKPPERKPPLDTSATHTTPKDPETVDEYADQLVNKLMSGGKLS